MGNICRSPTAEGAMRALLREQGLEDRVEVDSAGMGGWHAGEPPDARSTEAARRRGLTLAGAARQVRPKDFETFDLLVAMDRDNRRDLLDLAPDAAAAERVRMLHDAAGADVDVPDPYYGGERGFEDVLDLVQAGCRGLLEDLRSAGRV
jgi:protein-tyrosine phosphatase